MAEGSHRDVPTVGFPHALQTHPIDFSSAYSAAIRSSASCATGTFWATGRPWNFLRPCRQAVGADREPPLRGARRRRQRVERTTVFVVRGTNRPCWMPMMARTWLPISPARETGDVL